MIFEIKTKVQHNKPSKAIAKMASWGKSSKTKALKEGFDSKRRWGNSTMKGHGVNSSGMMESRKTDNYTPKHQ